MQSLQGFALADIIRELHALVMRVGMPQPARASLIEAMADVEASLAIGSNERLQLGALVGAFAVAREAVVAAAT